MCCIFGGVRSPGRDAMLQALKQQHFVHGQQPGDSTLADCQGLRRLWLNIIIAAILWIECSSMKEGL